MKNLKTIAIALLVAFSTVTVSAQGKKIDVSKSSINWLAKKVTGQHSGTVNFNAGALIFKGKKLVGGTFSVNMTSLTATDLSGEYQGKLNGHLKSEDFFGTEKFPTATLEFKKVTAKAKGVYTVTADLTIKGKTNPITFDLATTANTAITKVNIDRTKFDIKFHSKSLLETIENQVIDDDFELNIKLMY